MCWLALPVAGACVSSFIEKTTVPYNGLRKRAACVTVCVAVVIPKGLRGGQLLWPIASRVVPSTGGSGGGRAAEGPVSRQGHRSGAERHPPARRPCDLKGAR